MSQDNAANANANAANGAVEPNPKEAMFFYHILTSNKTKLEVNWEQVAQKSGYSNGACAQVRFRQVKKRLGLNEDGGAPSVAGGAPRSATPKKPRAKAGSGTNKTPSKVTKPRTPKKTSTSKAAEAEFFSSLLDDDEILKVEEAGVSNEDGGQGSGYYDDGNGYYDADEAEPRYAA